MDWSAQVIELFTVSTALVLGLFAGSLLTETLLLVPYFRAFDSPARLAQFALPIGCVALAEDEFSGPMAMSAMGQRLGSPHCCGRLERSKSAGAPRCDLTRTPERI